MVHHEPLQSLGADIEERRGGIGALDLQNTRAGQLHTDGHLCRTGFVGAGGINFLR